MPSPGLTPLVATLTSRFVPLKRSRTKISLSWFVSLGTTLSASLMNAMKRPSVLAEKRDGLLIPLGVTEDKAGCPAEISSVTLFWRSRRNTS